MSHVFHLLANDVGCDVPRNSPLMCSRIMSLVPHVRGRLAEMQEQMSPARSRVDGRACPAGFLDNSPGDSRGRCGEGAAHQGTPQPIGVVVDMPQ